jgi:glycosyltransferase involved in cell wall biosynthesis
MKRKKVLICALMPEVDRDSGSRRVNDLIEFMRQSGWAVTFLSHHANCKVRYARALQQRGVAVYAGAAEMFEPLVKNNEFDLAIFALWHVAEPHISLLRKFSPQTKILVDSIDFHMLRVARQVFSQKNGQGSSQLDSNYASEAVREINTYALADGVLTVSEKEADLINDFLGRSNKTYSVGLCEELEPSPLPPEERRGMCFIGCYRFPPNADAVAFLCRDIIPRLDPALTFRHPIHIIGDGLGPEIRKYGEGLPDVQMVGWVPSVFPYLYQSKISIIPLRFGAGTKGKLLQALMTGTPTVSTSIGAEGFAIQHGEHLLIANQPEEFAAAITTLLTDESLWQRLATQGRERILSFHARDSVRVQFLSAVDRVLSQASRKHGADNNGNLNGHHISIESYDHREGLRAAVTHIVPSRAKVAVVSRGDAGLLQLGDREAIHFPLNDSGNIYHPANSSDAVVRLEALRENGCEFLAFPKTALWWFDQYKEFREHLDARYTLASEQNSHSVVYDLRSADIRDSSRWMHSADNGAATPDDVRLIAFYLPQFHPIPENDRWWGKGFTEWTNVSKAAPLFPGHYQPHLPADLGYYDLRLPEVRQAQADLARQHGIHGFCYYHYWFGGKRLLDRPFNDVLNSGEPDFPFCLCWANEPWSRRWNGRPEELLQAQDYSPEDDLNHIRWLLPALSDRRAIQIEGKPVFIVYQGKELPDPARTVETWRREVDRAGLPGIYLMSVETGWDAGWDATQVGFDAKVLFQPQFTMLFNSGTRIPIEGKETLRVFDYQKAWPILANPEPVSYRRYDTVFPGWDNSARTGLNGVVVQNNSPEAYQEWLSQTIARARQQPPEHRIVFLNAWNEWAEGAHLEPDRKNQDAYLKATRDAISSVAEEIFQEA